MKGKFYDYFLELNALKQRPLMYVSEKRRPTFAKEFQNIWEQCEALLLLGMLYHTGDVSLIEQSKDYLASHINIFSDCRNKIINYMLDQVQGLREWQQ